MSKARDGHLTDCITADDEQGDDGGERQIHAMLEGEVGDGHHARSRREDEEEPCAQEPQRRSARERPEGRGN